MAGGNGKQADDKAFWISYGDLMTAMMVLFMLMLASALMEIHEKQEERAIVRNEIVSELVMRLEQKYPVKVDVQTGSITIADGILFGFNDTKLSEQGKVFLKDFIPDYTQVLLGNERTREHIAQIIIEGHADNVGTYEANLDKSLGRAYSVTSYIFATTEMGNFQGRGDLQQRITANGRANMDPLDTPEKSRRVEIKFRLKDWDLIRNGIAPGQ